MELRGKRVLIVGLAKTGEAAADFVLRRGARVTITETKPADALGPKAGLWRERGATVEAGGHRLETFLGADLIIPSPGVPRLAEIRAARERGVAVLSEIELAARFLQGRIAGITGTNGKSTTATLLHKILRESGRRAFLAGNIGTPLISFVDRSREGDIYVTEISSFQLEYIERFRAEVAVVLNVTQNHLDWHGTFEDYSAAKRKLVTGQVPGDAAVLNRDDAGVWALREEAASTAWAFSRRRPVRRGAFLRDGWIVLRDEAERRLLPLSEIKLPGDHNRENVMAAALAARVLEVEPRAIRAAVGAFRGLEHRLEPVLSVRGVSFVNDSKATTVDAALKALAAFDRPIVLILGGKDKGSDFRPLRRALKRNVRKVILVGAAKDKLRRTLQGVVALDEAKTYPEVVSLAFAAASRGDVVLLAPACTSWDMFADFEERGRVFKGEVRKLARRVERTRG
jgi:UDP-N-acetylmuramoylalanine--D-glutamate ligase